MIFRCCNVALTSRNVLGLFHSYLMGSKVDTPGNKGSSPEPVHIQEPSPLSIYNMCLGEPTTAELVHLRVCSIHFFVFLWPPCALPEGHSMTGKLSITDEIPVPRSGPWIQQALTVYLRIDWATSTVRTRSREATMARNSLCPWLPLTCYQPHLTAHPPPHSTQTTV